MSDRRVKVSDAPYDSTYHVRENGLWTEFVIDTDHPLRGSDTDGNLLNIVDMTSTTQTVDAATYYSSTKVTSTSTSFTDVTGASLGTTGLTHGATYLVYAHAHVGNTSSGAADSNGVQIVAPSGTALTYSIQNFESTGYSAANANNFGDPYSFMGWFTNDTGGVNVHMEYKKSSGGGTSVFANRIGMFCINLTNIPNHQKIEDTTTTTLDGSNAGTEVSTSAALTLAAGDYLIFSSVLFGGFSGGASECSYFVDDGTTAWVQGGCFVQDTATDNWCQAGAFVLEGYAGGTITITGHMHGGVNGADILRAALVAIPLSDFTEAYYSQNATASDAEDDGTGANTVCETVSIASVAQAGSWMVLGWGMAKHHASTPTIGFDTQEDINSGGAATKGGDLTQKTNLITAASSYNHEMCISNTFSTYAAADAVTLTTRYDVNGTGGGWFFRHEGVVAVRLQTGGDALTISDDSLNTIVDGQIITLSPTDHVRVVGNLRVYDTGATDYIQWAHDGTDVNQTYLATTDHNIGSGLSGAVRVNAAAAQDSELSIGEPSTARGDAANAVLSLHGENTSTIREANLTNTGLLLQVNLLSGLNAEVTGDGDYTFSFKDGARLRSYDSTDSDYVERYHDGTDLFETAVNTRNLDIVGLTGAFRIRDGAKLSVLDSTDADSISIYHDGSNSYIEADVGELFFLRAGASRLSTDANGVLELYSDGSTDAEGRRINFLHQDGTLRAFVGFDSDAVFNISNTAGNIGLAPSSHVAVETGKLLRVYDSLDTDYIQLAATSTVTTISSTQHVELTPAASHYVSVFRSGSTIDFRVYDGGGTDYAAFNHNGTNFNVALTNTTSMAFSGVTASYTFDKQLHVSTTGSQIKIQETDAADPADYWLAEMDGSNLNFYFRDNSAAAFILPLRLDALNKSITVRDGCSFTIYNSGMTDFGSFAHDGTDFNLTPANTNAFRLKSGLDFAINSDDNGTSSIYFTPGATSGSACTISGTGATHFTTTYVRAPYLQITDGVTAPGTVSGQAQIYVDSADGDLKVKFGDGTVATIAVDT